MPHPVLANGFHNGLEVGETHRLYDVAVRAAAITFCDVADCLGIGKDDHGRERQRVLRLNRPYLAEYGKTVRSRERQVQQD